jgi:multicomponent Na+:H+ antiporter subunit A
LALFLKPIVLLSVLTWVIGGLLFWKLDEVRKFLRRVDDSFKWDFDIGFDWLMFGLIRLADKLTRVWHHGRLELYMLVVFISLGAALILPLLFNGGLPPIPSMPLLNFYEWGVILMAVVGLLAVLIAKTRLVAIVSLGIQGFAVGLIFLLFGAPDLAFTQFMVETLTVVILALVMTRLYLDQRDARRFEDILRDGGLALVCGVGLMLVLMVVLQEPLDLSLTEFFAANSVVIAHGHNIVNVILVDFRGLDTLGEIGVVMTAGIAILALIRIRAGGPQVGIGAQKKSAKKKRIAAISEIVAGKAKLVKKKSTVKRAKARGAKT